MQSGKIDGNNIGLKFAQTFLQNLPKLYHNKGERISLNRDRVLVGQTDNILSLKAQDGTARTISGRFQTI